MGDQDALGGDNQGQSPEAQYLEFSPGGLGG